MATSPITAPPETAATLRRAADLIEQHGWTQNTWYRSPNSDGHTTPEHWKPGYSMCLAGALMLAAGGDTRTARNTAYRDARDAVATHIPWPTLQLSEWNDAEGRTAKEVIARLRKTANRIDPQGTDR